MNKDQPAQNSLVSARPEALPLDPVLHSYGLSWPLGFQGKLIVSFLLLLMLGLEADGFIYASQTQQRMTELLGEQARQTAYGLAMASAQPMAMRQTESLGKVGQDLLRSRNNLFVIFYDPDSHPISISHRDPDYSPASQDNQRTRPAALMQVRQGSSPLLGDFVEVWAPVLGYPDGENADPGAANPVSGGKRVLGYVAVGVSLTPEQAQLSRINILAGVIAGLVVLGSVPLVFLIIHRILKPIRQLVGATERMAAGSYDTQVDVDRMDVIGTLARSFNVMAKTVKGQQDEMDLKLERALGDLKIKNVQLEKLAATDPLTTLYNRRHFGRVLEQLYAEATRYQDDLACVMIDLDEYKLLNDKYGHSVGDHLLVVAAQAISTNIRRMDVAARYGGDEFILLLPRSGCEEAAAISQRIRDEFRLATAAALKRPEGVTMSMGIASLKTDRPKTADQLVNLADAALYQAKAFGRDRSVIHIDRTPTPAAAG